MPQLFMLRTSASVQRTVQLPHGRSAEITALLLQIGNPYMLLSLFTMFWLNQEEEKSYAGNFAFIFSGYISYIYSRLWRCPEVHLSSYEEKIAPHSEEPKVIWF